MLFYSEDLLRHSFISQSRLDVTSFVTCLNLYSKRGKQGALQCSPSLFAVLSLCLQAHMESL